jgi:hypothetical protein
MQTHTDLPTPREPAPVDDIDPDSDFATDWLAELEQRLDGPWYAWGTVTRDDQRRLVRLARRLLDAHKARAANRS